MLDAEDGEHVPARDVEEREERDAQPPRARNRHRLAGTLRHREQRNRRKRQRGGAKREWRELGDPELQDRPVAAPRETQDRDQRETRRQADAWRRGRFHAHLRAWSPGTPCPYFDS